ncbi:hypothetical protein, variant [Cryptococcus amylolentus CBS 6039]|uniref:Uncharacterized protein n=1 Tax=Cryptococcus amylolentus CBS 6039 TaxID=1295533 RepID=A0A1E3HR31_9TREE|nr:hypothetical protein L202_04332 [Cryptococcus amylolentus CBS 6039]XP_018993819.1 hypothetical protein, variant [Cryptococcus amylolentus CBS 6039]ODN78772.1 hypothetical protein L202_04332 [Cryptococcus amylolentus CBS 6039]ODN78773.1 hypothetical protein, variant [Cryptococcus amylolentus CBS 6039]
MAIFGVFKATKAQSHAFADSAAYPSTPVSAERSLPPLPMPYMPSASSSTVNTAGILSPGGRTTPVRPGKGMPTPTGARADSGPSSFNRTPSVISRVNTKMRSGTWSSTSSPSATRPPFLRGNNSSSSLTTPTKSISRAPKALLATPTSASQAPLPPPSYALPPTPEASPQKGISTIFESRGASATISHRGSFKNPSRGGGRMSNPRTTRYASGSSDVSSNISNASSTSSGNGRLQRVLSGRRTSTSISTSRPAQLDAYDGPVLEINAEPSRTSKDGRKSAEGKRRPTALKLRTSNLTPEPSPPAGKGEDVDPSIAALPPSAKPSRITDIGTSALAPPLMSPAKALSTLGTMLSARDPEPSQNSNRTVRPEDSSSPPVWQKSFDLVEPQLKPLRLLERRRSKSTGDAIEFMRIGRLQRDLGGGLTPSSSALHRLSPSKSGGLSPKKTTGRDEAKDKSVSTPASALTIDGDAPHSRPPSPSPFLNLPLPWSTVDLPTITADLGLTNISSLVNYTVNQLDTSSPHLLPPAILKNCASEEGRLRAELERLREKYDTLAYHRGSLQQQIENSVLKVEQTKLHKMVQALRKVTARCDRVARQIFICNDQIRQIEIQGQEHVVGALRVKLNEVERQAYGLKPGGSHLSPASGSSSSESAATPTPTHTSTSKNFLDDVYYQSLEPVTPSSKKYGGNESRRTSQATMISLNRLTFPVPPDRIRTLSTAADDMEQLDDKIGWQGSLKIEIEDMVDDGASSHDLDSAPSPTLTDGYMASQDGHTILILPPTAHMRSSSAPDWPVTSRIESGDNAGPYDMASPSFHSASAPYLLQPHSPLGAAGRHGRAFSDSSNHPQTTSAPLSPTAMQQMDTAPLNLDIPGMGKLVKGRGTRMTKSMSAKGEGLKKLRKGRESMLDTPESILWSLATAPMWTKQELDSQ